MEVMKDGKIQWALLIRDWLHSTTYATFLIWDILR